MRSKPKTKRILKKVYRGAVRRISGFKVSSHQPVLLRESQLPRNKKIAGLVAHADDLALSAGRTVFALTRKSRQNDFHSFVLMSGQRAVKGVSAERRRTAIRRVEAFKEARLLGAHSNFLRLSFYETKRVSKKDVERTVRELEKIRPQALFIPHSLDKSHPDHIFTHMLGLAVAKELVLKYGAPIEIWECESVWDPIPNSMVNTVVLNSKRASETQSESLKVHGSQMSRTPFDKINLNESFKRRMLLGEKLAGFGNKPKRVPDSDNFIRYRLVKRKGKIVKEPITA